MKFQFDDGGRQNAGFKGSSGDCVCRAISIVSGKPYIDVYNDLNSIAKEFNKKKYKTLRGKSSARTGMHKQGSFMRIRIAYGETDRMR